MLPLLQVAYGRGRPPDMGVAAYILNKQSRTTDNGRSSSLGFGGGLTTPHRKQPECYEMLHRALDVERPRQRKGDMRLGTWNVRFAENNSKGIRKV
jgi:hypothetical protein